MGTRFNTRKSGEFRYATRHVALEKGKRSQTKDVAPLRACKQLLKSDDWEKSKFSLIPKNSSKKLVECKSSSLKETKNRRLHPKNKEKVVIVSKKSSSVRVVKSGSQRCLKGVQRSVSVKKVSYSTSVILSSEEDGDEDDESDSEDDDDDDDDDECDDDDDYHEKPRTSSLRRGTVIKHTTSKIKTNYCSSKRTDNRSSKKAKALKLLREKSNKKKSNASSYRELRPRFPYSPTQEWPTARAHRMASLNALAKVHVLYENEGRVAGESEENYLLETLSDDVSSNDSSKASLKDSKCGIKDKDNIKAGSKGSKNIDAKSKPIKKTRKRKLPPDVEIIDTRMCKRMASLNAQAILAASYVQEKPRKREKIKKIQKPQSSPETDVEYKEIILESSCNLQIVDSEKDQSPLNIDSSPQDSLNNDIEDRSRVSKKHKQESKIQMSRGSKAFKNQNEESCELSPIQSQLCVPSPGSDSNATTATSVSEVGVTKYTQVTKVHINSTKEMEIKEESKAERKIESILEKDDVAITEMYHYQSNTSSQSYSVRMQTTYKPMSRNFNSPSSHQRSGPIPSPHVMGAVMPTRQSYYNYHNRPGVLASQSYPMSRSGNNLQPMLGMDPPQYGSSAFTVPHYGHPPHMAYPRNDYGYYQPAGPMIQPGQDQYMIHKPVPFHPHPQTQHHTPQSSGATSSNSRDHYPPPNEACFSQHSLPSTPEMKHKPMLSRSEMSSPHRSPHLPSSPQNSSRTNNQCMTNLPSEQNMNTHSYDSRSHDSVPGPHMHGQYPMPEKSENFKYGMHSSQNYPRSQDHLVYTAANHRDRSGYPPNHPASSYHAKAHHSQDPSNFNQYVEPMQQHPSARNVSKFEHTRDSNKHSHGLRQHDHYKNIGNYHRDSEAQSSADRTNKHRNLWRPPTVVDVEQECESRNTKTYIELDVPKACPQEKIVIVDVDKEDMKEQNVNKCDPVCLTAFTSSQEKTMDQPDIIEITNPKTLEKANLTELIAKTEIIDSSSESPDVLVIGVMKKKEPSALIRRAKLHGKQRTYRDSENRPLAPYTNIKKAINTSEIPFDHQSSIFQPQVSISRLVLPENFETKLLHGWSWDGKPSEKLVYVRNDDPPFLRLCYPAIRHHEGDIVKVRDCVLLKSGARKTDLPFIAKVTALWENPADGEMMMSLLWYYRPEHTEPGRKPFHVEGEIFASKHCDTNSVACIEDKCYVLTSGEYCRYRRHCKMLESTCQSPVSVVPPIDDYIRKDRLPPSCISPEMVFFCRKVYDFRQKRILKNPM